LQYLQYLQDYCFENKIDYLIIDGDVFDKSSNIKNEAFVPIFLKLLEMKELGIKMIFIPGNHDIMNVDNDSIIETFRSFATVYKVGTDVELLNDKFYFLPYTKSEKDLPEPSHEKYLITHLSIADFSFDNAYHATEKHAFKRSLFEGWRQVFTGHFHRAQIWKNICYVGSPVQMNRGEKGQTKGFVVLDTDLEKWDFIEYTQAPTFVEITEDDIMNIKNMSFDNKYVVVRINQKIKDYAKLRYILYEKGAIDIIPVFESEDEDSGEIQEVDINTDLDKMTKEIIMEMKQEGIDNQLLIKIFDEVLEKC